MERYEYMFLILKPIKVTFKTYGNYIHFTLKHKKKKKKKKNYTHFTKAMAIMLILTMGNYGLVW